MLKMLLPMTLPTAMSRSPLQRRGDRGRDLGQRGAGGDDGQADHEVAHAQSPWRRRPPAVTSQSEPSTSAASPATMSTSCTGRRLSQAPGVLDGSSSASAPAATSRPRARDCTTRKHRVGQQQREQQRAVEHADAAVLHQHQQQQRGADHDRHLLADRAARVTTSGTMSALRPRMKSTLKMLLPTTLPIAMSVWPLEHRTDRDRHLGRAGAEGDHGQADHERRDAEGQREPGGAAHQQVWRPARARPGRRRRAGYSWSAVTLAANRGPGPAPGVLGR